MEQLTFGACVKKTWGSSWQAITAMPRLFLGVCAVLACTSLLFDSHMRGPTGAITTVPSPGNALLWLGSSVLQGILYGVLTIKVHRFVLIGEGVEPLLPLNGKPLGRYLLVWLGIAASMLVVAVALFLAVRAAHAFAVVIYVPVIVVFVFVLTRLSLVYPAIALGSRVELRAAWNDSRGHVWSIFGVGIVSYLPLVIVSVIFGIVVGIKHAALGQHPGLAVTTIGQTLFNAMFIVLAAASMSWLYRRYASELLAHVEDAPQ
jgi:hypothetical protein